jgi:hypothetical protein
MRNFTLTIQFCDISQSFVSAIKYENTYTNILMLWFGDFCYLRIFKKVHSISGRGLSTQTIN